MRGLRLGSSLGRSKRSNVKNGESTVTPPNGQEPAETIRIDQAARLIHGPSGHPVELPFLSLRVLEVLDQRRPAYVSGADLQQAVWPDTFITSDTVKQRIRLLRAALEEAGYEARLIDSVRGQGYRLQARLEAVRSDAPAVSAPPRLRTWWQRTLLMLGLLVGTALLAVALRRAPPPATIGPVPLRVRLIGAPPNPEAQALVDALAAGSHVLPIQADMPAPDACGDPAAAHLCLMLAPETDGSTGTRVTLRHLATGAALWQETMRAEPLPGDGRRLALRLSAFTNPQVLRWLGSSSAPGHRTFSAYREAVRTVGSCDGPDHDRAIARLTTALETAPTFAAGAALLAYLQAEVAVSRRDTARAELALRQAADLISRDPDLTLAHLAMLRTAAFAGGAGPPPGIRDRFAMLEPAGVGCSG